jgi:SAM-dependent methyltransferase
MPSVPATRSDAAGDAREPGADDWDAHWDAFSPAAVRNPAQEYRRVLALRLLERKGPPDRLLDIGSGQGDFLLAARHRWPHAQLAGIEVSEHGTREARAKVPDADIEVRDLLVLGEPPAPRAAWATHAVCSEVLEHVDDPVRLLEQARAYLAPGSRLVVTVPGGRMSAFDRHIGHRRHFTPASLAQTLTAAGLRVTWTGGAGFPFFNVYRLLVIARGEHLKDDAVSARGGGPELAIRIAMAGFRPLFRLNLPQTPWGTQIVAVARNAGRT